MQWTQFCRKNLRPASRTAESDSALERQLWAPNSVKVEGTDSTCKSPPPTPTGAQGRAASRRRVLPALPAFAADCPISTCLCRGAAPVFPNLPAISMPPKRKRATSLSLAKCFFHFASFPKPAGSASPMLGHSALILHLLSSAM